MTDVPTPPMPPVIDGSLPPLTQKVPAAVTLIAVGSDVAMKIDSPTGTYVVIIAREAMKQIAQQLQAAAAGLVL
jgi:hypothetical protein